MRVTLIKFKSLLKNVLIYYTFLEEFIHLKLIHLINIGYIKLSIILNTFFFFIMLPFLYIVYLITILIVLMYYILNKTNIKIILTFLYEEVFIKLFFLIVIKFLNTLLFIPLFLLYRLFKYFFYNTIKRPINMVSFLIYIGEFILLPINTIKNKIKKLINIINL